jgi:hypothetical protein
LEYSSTRGVLFYMGTGGGNSNITANLTPALTTWTHIAVTRSNGYAKIFINGGQVVGASLTSSSVSTEPLVIGSSKNGTYPLNGYLSDVRITKGLARYTYNFTPPTQAFGTFFQAQTTPTADPYFDYTTLLLPGNGTNGAQNNTFLDSSTNAFTITRNGNTTQGTFTPFSQTGWSNYFDGSGDYLTIPNNTALQFGSGDFTIEAWIYPTVLAFGDVFSKGDYGGGATAGYFEFRKTDTNAMSFYSNNTGTALTTSSTMQLSNWSHVAVSRSGTTVRIFINGVLCASGTDSTTYSNTGLSAIGAASQTSYTNFFDGYISNLRVVKGTAVYTTNFTPSTTALTAISGTSLLTCQNNRFIDNSTNAFTLTANGNVAVQAYSPFAPTSAYSAATVGGSGYFDGSGDALLLADSSQFTLGTNNFTVEAWVYPTTTGVQRIISGQSNSGASGSTISYWLDINSSNQPRILIWSGATDYTATSSVAVSSNQWVHIAGVRNGNTLSIYVNGVSTGTVSVTGVTVNDSSNQLAIGQLGEHTNVPWSGYISSFRLVNGTAVYTSTFTPPSAPLTAITNTSLLTNFTNAGIIDSTAQNDLETVGNAQISNTIAKWGSTSMYFDGSGDSLSLPNSFNFRKGDWTIECWIYFNTSTISKTWFVQNNGTQFYTSNTGKLRIDTKVSGGDKRITGTTDLVTGQWYHVAATRYGATQMLFLNGQLEGTFDLGTSSLDVRTDPTSIGSVFEGYIQDMRVTTGIARYTQNFTPPTAAFQLL